MVGYARSFHKIDLSCGSSRWRQLCSDAVLDNAASLVSPYPGRSVSRLGSGVSGAVTGSPAHPVVARPGGVRRRRRGLRGARRVPGRLLPFCPPLHEDLSVTSALLTLSSPVRVWAALCGFIQSLPVFCQGIALDWGTLFSEACSVVTAVVGVETNYYSRCIVAGSFIARFRFFGLKDLRPLPSLGSVSGVVASPALCISSVVPPVVSSEPLCSSGSFVHLFVGGSSSSSDMDISASSSGSCSSISILANSSRSSPAGCSPSSGSSPGSRSSSSSSSGLSPSGRSRASLSSRSGSSLLGSPRSGSSRSGSSRSGASRSGSRSGSSRSGSSSSFSASYRSGSSRSRSPRTRSSARF